MFRLGSSRLCAVATALAAALLALALAGCAHTPKGPPTAISVTTSTDEEGIQITQAGSNVLIEIHSPGGLGSGWFKVARRPPVAEVRVRLHTRGLEEFRLAQGGAELRVSVASHAGNAVQEAVQRAGQLEQPLAATDPLWIPVQIVPTDGAAKTIPLAAGWFELTLPAGLNFEAGSDFRLSWVDFFR